LRLIGDVVKKFDQIEVDGKMHAVEFKRPTYRHKVEYLKTVLPLQNEATAFQKEVEGGDVQNPEKGVEIVEKLNRARWKILLKLHNGGQVFKTEDSFMDVADRDLEMIYGWLEAQMGLKKTEAEQDFLSDSEKSPR